MWNLHQTGGTNIKMNNIQTFKMYEIRNLCCNKVKEGDRNAEGQWLVKLISKLKKTQRQKQMENKQGKLIEVCQSTQLSSKS